VLNDSVVVIIIIPSWLNEKRRRGRKNKRWDFFKRNFFFTLKLASRAKWMAWKEEEEKVIFGTLSQAFPSCLNRNSSRIRFLQSQTFFPPNQALNWCWISYKIMAVIGFLFHFQVWFCAIDRKLSERGASDGEISAIFTSALFRCDWGRRATLIGLKLSVGKIRYPEVSFI
jgi:hypothetical protein